LPAGLPVLPEFFLQPVSLPFISTEAVMLDREFGLPGSLQTVSRIGLSW
jgi:hypothetical protein